MNNKDKNLCSYILHNIRKSRKKKFNQNYWKNQIIGLENIFGKKSVVFDKKKNMLTCITKNIIIKGVTLGRYSISYDITKAYNGSAYLAKTYFIVSNNQKYWCKSCDNYTHPHVYRGRMCLNNTEIIHSLYKENDIVSIFEIYKNTLNSYNSDDPYCPIESWNKKHLCGECGIYYSSKEYVCYSCGIGCCYRCKKILNNKIYCRECKEERTE